ncbi:MAG TPA: class I SAM-dependent methyltransferase [Rhizomicrobium sp.]|nr:class I SAM-dependent methyltransferase [Rhizomicrobium sp.]
MSVPSADFCQEYTRHRANEGRALSGKQLRSLPYLREGALARQWAVRARTFETFMNRILEPLAAHGPIHLLDLGAGNGWLSHRVAGYGNDVVAVDIRDDDVDGLGAAADLASDASAPFQRVKASFDNLPFDDNRFNLVVFNASLHYATDLARALTEASRVTRSGGCVAVLDSPFYRSDQDGRDMVAEKWAEGHARFGSSAEVLLTQNFVEYLTPERLAEAQPGISWMRHRVGYPLWYEMRPLLARLKGRRKPSRFDLWTARVP